MNDILDRAKAHYREKRQGMHEILIPEWESSIWIRNCSNLKEQSQITKYSKDGDLKALAMNIIIRALDEEGKKIFKPVHVAELMAKTDQDVLIRICAEINGDDENEDTVEEAVKNSEATES